MGAVGGRVGVRNVNENAATMVQTFVYYTQFNLMKVLESFTRSVCCISGCLFAIRRELLLKLESKVRGRNWFGVQVNDGEDRYLTHLVLLEGYTTYINPDAQCWTNVPSSLNQLIKQQIRWRRSGVRDFFFTLKSLPRHVRILHPNAVYNLIVPPLVGVVVVITLLAAPLTDFNWWMSPFVFVLWAAAAAIFNWHIKKHNPEQAVTDPLRCALYAVWTVAAALITVFALFSFDATDWGTRSKKPAPEPERQPEVAVSFVGRSKELLPEALPVTTSAGD